jgi:hypothetical protein
MLTDMNTPAYKKRTGLSKAGLILVGALVMVSCGITAPRSNEGYANLDSLGVFDTDRTMALSIGPTVLRIAIWALDEDEPETAALLRDLDGVRIRIYEIDGDSERVAGRVQKMSLQLREDDWQPVMLIQEDGEQTHMLMRSEGDRIQGLTLITSDDEEAVVINLMGHLNPENWTEVMEALDVDSPDVVVDPITEVELAPMQ